MKKILLFTIFTLASPFYVCAQEKECEDRINDNVRLEAAISNTKTIKEKREKYQMMLQNLNFIKENGCIGDVAAKKQIARVKRLLDALASPQEHDNRLYRDSVTINADQDSVRIVLKHSKGVRVLDIPGWLKLQETGDMKALMFIAEENVIPHSRTGVIELEDGKRHHQIRVTQKGASLQANVTEYIGFGQDQGIGTIFVETNDTAWTVSVNATWLEADLTDYGAIVMCSKNPMKSKRFSKINVRFACGETRDVEISQAIGTTTLSVPNKEFTFGHDGGINNDVKVDCNYDQWSASPDADWIKVRRKYSGISIECLPNKIASMRTARVRVETNDEEHLVEYILVRQSEAPAYLTAEQSTIHSNGYEKTINVRVNTNIPSSSWQAKVEDGASWTSVRTFQDYIRISVGRNDLNASRTSKIRLYGKGENYTVSITQPNRGYVGRYKDYYEAKGGCWHFTWVSMDFHALTTIGNNLSFMNVRWKPVEVSLLNLNLDYVQDSTFGASWEPIVRGYVPISRNGKWAAFAGIGGHFCMTEGESHFLLELGMDVQWSAKTSSRMFFKYNGAASLGISFDLGRWR